MPGSMTRRTLLGGLGLTTLAGILAACQSATSPSSAPTAAASAPTAAAASAPTSAGSAPTAAAASAPTSAATVSTAAKPAATSAPTGSPVTLEQYTWSGQLNDAYPTLTKSFLQKSNVTVKVTTVGFNDYWNKLTTMFAADAPPDSAWNHTSYIQADVKLGVLRELTPYITGTPGFPTDWSKASWALYHLQGKQWGTPLDFAVRAVFYNQTVLQKAGITLGPIGDWTWDDVKQWGSKVTVDHSGRHPGDSGFDVRSVATWGMTGFKDGWSNQLRPLIMTWGTDLFNEDSTVCQITDAKVLAALQWLSDSVNTWKINSPPPVETQQANLFSSGAAAIASDFTSLVFQFIKEPPKFEWDAAPFPKGPNGKQTVNVGSSCNAIPAKSGHPDAAWQWVAFQASDEAQTVWAKLGSVPPRTSIAPVVVDSYKVSKNFKQVFIDDADTIGVAVWEHPKRAEVEKALTDEFQLVWLGKKDVETAAKAAKAKVDPLLKQT